MFESQFQSFAAKSERSQGKARVALLRAELARRGLDGFIVPRGDEHQNEYVPKSAERLRWLTGFSGSAGTAVILAKEAAIFIDGRYTLQVREQVDAAVLAPHSSEATPPSEWIEARLSKGAKLGYDPWLHTPGMVAACKRAAEAAGGTLVPVDSNPVDAIWHDRPAAPLGAVALFNPRVAGEASAKKVARVQAALGKADGLVVSDAHSVAWLFNMRGADVSHTPLPLSFALVPRAGKPTLFIDARKLSNSVRASLADAAEIAEPSTLVAAMARLGGKKQRLRFDAATAPARLTQALAGAGGEADVGADPVALMKAAKNRAELAGTRKAHVRDGAAVVNFLCWFDAEAPKGKLTEIDAVKALEGFRRATGKLKDVSFPSIAGAGPHAAIPHYSVSDASNARIGKGIFLIDSGGQYEDGTTDITRTLAVGKPSAEMRDRFTRVLKGHIAISTAVFPRGASGSQLDSFARAALWQAGLDFDHGTGHGVGVYLSVHEGPARISKLGTVPLREGIILSNEPGYYKAGAWGIRIENLIVVEKREIKGADREMFGFETITFAPIDLRLVEAKLLTAQERAWLNAYHAQVRRLLTPLVDAKVARWLKAATRKV